MSYEQISGLQVCQSTAGYYIGRMVTMVEHMAGRKYSWEYPYSRNSEEYWKTEAEAQAALESGKFTYREF